MTITTSEPIDFSGQLAKRQPGSRQQGSSTMCLVHHGENAVTKPNHPPLWQVMETAFLAGRNPGYCDRRGYAAELRAIAEWLVPKEAMIVEGGRTYEQAWLVSERERLRSLLLDEADRAEAGE